MKSCGKCVNEGPKFWCRGDDEEMRSYCFVHRIYEPYKVCDDYKEFNKKSQENEN